MITELSRVHPISKLTKILEVPKSTYYYRKLNKLTVNKIQREKLSKLIYEIWLRSHKRYGAPKIHQELIKLGEFHSLKHIQNLMREKDIRSITVKKFKPEGGNNDIDESKVPNILKQNFDSEKAHEKIVGDITYIYTKRDGWCYLSSYMDLYNNEILGWSFSKEMTTKIVIESLEMACLKIKNTNEVIVHTDRGSQYTSNIYRELIQKKLNWKSPLDYKKCS